MIQNKYMLYSQRAKLGKMFSEWAEKNGICQSPESVVSWLYASGLIDSDKAKELINGKTNDNSPRN